MTIQFPRVGDRFLDRYQITEVLGAGGMSRVYGAIQDGLDRRVAIKLLAPAGAENLTSSQFDNIVARFEREAKLISSFRSSHTVVMYDYGRSGDYLFMILEHVDGQNLHEVVEATGPLPASRVARIVRQALSSLAEAHQMGILHRDIKPQNIMVYEHLGDPDNTKVLDFGIAKAIGETGKDQRKLTEERTIVGTPSYMSPEQILGNQLSAGSDIYSLGLVAYEVLFGIVAVEADSAVSTMARHLAPTPIEIPDNRHMPPAFLDILRKMINKDVAQRYASVAEVLDDLNAWDGGDPNLTLPRISSSFERKDTLDGMPGAPRPPQTTEQATGDHNQPLVVGSALLLTLAILLAVGVVVALVWMMQDRPAVAEVEPPPVAAVAQPGMEGSGAASVVEPLEEEPVLAQQATDDAMEEAPELADPAAIDEPPAVEPEKAAEKVAATPTKKRSKKQAQKAAAADEPDETAEAVQPPEPLVVEPPQPEPAVTATADPVVEPTPKPEPKPEPKETVAENAESKTTEAKKSDEKSKKSKKKKKKKRKAPPLSF